MSDNLLEFLDKEISAFTDIPEKAKEDPSKDLDFLVELIDREVATLASLMEKTSGEVFKVEEATKSIPLVSISELGWADPTKEGGKISNPARAEMAEYLAPITSQSRNLTEAFQAIQKFMDARIARKDDLPLSEMLSFLVFYKTLNHVIANFNPATAGFLFEALLGITAGGEQVPTGSETIADLKYKGGINNQGQTVWVSLKLLGKGGTSQTPGRGTEVDGSFTDLINDLADPEMNNKMQYIVALKDISGKGDETRGSLSIYEFEFNESTLDPFLRLTTETHTGKALKGSKSSNTSMRIADKAGRALLDGEPLEDTRIEFGQDKESDFPTWANEWLTYQVPDFDDDEMEDFENAVGASHIKWMQKWEQMDDEQQKAALELGYPKNEEEFLDRINSPETWTKIGDPEYGGKDDPTRGIFSPFFKYAREEYAQGHGSASKQSEFFKPSESEDFDARVKMIKMPKKLKKGEALQNHDYEWMSVEDSNKFLAQFQGQEYWDAIKKYSHGYLKTGRFSISQNNLMKAPGIAKTAEIQVGQQLIYEAYKSYVKGTNQRVGKIYREVGELAQHLRGFFMSDLESEQGKEAKKAAQRVAYDTGKLIKGEGE